MGGEKSCGYLAKEFGGKDLPLQVCSSVAGFYLGTLTPDGEPYSQESVDYWRTREKAEEALWSDPPTWTQKLTP